MTFNQGEACNKRKVVHACEDVVQHTVSLEVCQGVISHPLTPFVAVTEGQAGFRPLAWSLERELRILSSEGEGHF